MSEHSAPWPPPSNKSLEMQRMLSDLAGREENIFDRADCAQCNRTDLKPSDFRDNVSRTEFGLSRMCQSCQDATFGTD